MTSRPAPLFCSALLIAALTACGRETTSGSPAVSPAPKGSPSPAGVVPLPETAARAQWGTHNVPAEMSIASDYRVTVSVANAGDAPWPDPVSMEGLPGAVLLSYHWLTPDRQMHFFEGEREGLGRMVAPGETVPASVTVRPPQTAGDYILQLDLLQGAAFWFAEKGSQTLEIPVKVK
jgi:hypothetical protein